jgi:hypothetical protein
MNRILVAEFGILIDILVVKSSRQKGIFSILSITSELGMLIDVLKQYTR